MRRVEVEPLTFDDPLSNYIMPGYEDRLAEALAERTVSCMQLTPFAEISPDASITDAVRALAGLRISSLLVVKDKRLVGIITERDILERTSEQFRRIGGRPVADIMTAHPAVVYDDAPAAPHWRPLPPAVIGTYLC